MWIKIAGVLVDVPGAAAQTPAPQRPAPTGRYTRFGFRIGHPQGPWEYRDASRCAESHMLVKNPEEQDIMRRILATCDGTGASANRLAVCLRGEGVLHPRLAKPWRPGSILMIYGTHRRHREEGLMDLIAVALSNQVGVSPTRHKENDHEEVGQNASAVAHGEPGGRPQDAHAAAGQPQRAGCSRLSG